MVTFNRNILRLKYLTSTWNSEVHSQYLAVLIRKNINVQILKHNISRKNPAPSSYTRRLFFYEQTEGRPNLEFVLFSYHTLTHSAKFYGKSECLRMRTSGRLLWTRQWTFVFPKKGNEFFDQMSNYQC